MWNWLSSICHGYAYHWLMLNVETHDVWMCVCVLRCASFHRLTNSLCWSRAWMLHWLFGCSAVAIFMSILISSKYMNFFSFQIVFRTEQNRTISAKRIYWKREKEWQTGWWYGQCLYWMYTVLLHASCLHIFWIRTRRKWNTLEMKYEC